MAIKGKYHVSVSRSWTKRGHVVLLPHSRNAGITQESMMNARIDHLKDVHSSHEIPVVNSRNAGTTYTYCGRLAGCFSYARH